MKFSYPTKVLLRAFTPTLVLAALLGAVGLRSLWQGRPGLALYCLLMFCIAGTPAFLLTLIVYSTIEVDDKGVSALALGVMRWRRALWSEVAYLQRVRVLTTLNRGAKPESEVYYIGFFSRRKVLRIAFRNTIHDLSLLTSNLDTIARERKVTIFSVDTVPKHYPKMGTGDIVTSLSAEPL